MAFMMPVMKNQYNIYPCRSRNSSVCSNGSRSRTVSESAKSDVLSTSPQSTTSDPPLHRHHNYILTRGALPISRSSRSHSQDSESEDARDSSSGSSDPALPSSPSKTGSMSSLQKFHSKLVDKLRRKFKGSSGKGNGEDEDGEDEGAKSGRSSS